MGLMGVALKKKEQKKINKNKTFVRILILYTYGLYCIFLTFLYFLDLAVA